jgi:hypothetical protein
MARFQDILRKNHRDWWLWEVVPMVVFGVVIGLAVLWAVGVRGQGLLTPEEARKYREQQMINRLEGKEIPQTAWVKQQVKNGVVTNIVAKPVNSQAIWVDASRFTKLTEFQRSTLISELANKQLPKAKKPLPVVIYDTTADGKQGKKIGSYGGKGKGLSLTIKFDEPPEFDNEADMFKIDPKPKK